MQNFKTLTTFLMIFTSVAHATEPLIYVVKKGDTVSTIAQKEIGSPIYSKNGSIAKLLALNPWIKNKDLVLAGQPLVVGRSEESHPLASKASSEPMPNRSLASEDATLPKKSEVPMELKK